MATKQEILSKLSVVDLERLLVEAKKREHDAEQKRIKDANRAFDRLPNYRKRIEIAKDVLLQLAAGRLKATSGAYLKFDTIYDRQKFYDAIGRGLKISDAVKDATCNVCGIGSLFIAAAERTQCKATGMEEANDDGFMRKHLGKWFDADQLDMIESAFEMRYIANGDSDLRSDDAAIQDSIKFTHGWQSATTRLKMIMQNIIDNNGTFAP